MMPRFPDALKPYAEAIRRTELPIIGAAVLEDAPAAPASSQLGGLPWWPAAMPYPTGKDGAPLFLLAQFNFAECAPLEPFPAHGLLQFFIGSTSDYLYGCNLDDLLSPHGFRCAYHEDLTQGRLEDFGFLGPLGGDVDVLLPLQEPLRARALSLARTTMLVEMGARESGKSERKPLACSPSLESAGV